MKAIAIAIAWFSLVSLTLLWVLAPDKLERLRKGILEQSRNTELVPGSATPPKKNNGCDLDLPAHGRHLIPLKAAPDAGISIASELSFPAVALFIDAQGAEVAALMVYPGKTLHSRMVSGDFTLVLLGGNQWCNLEAGFLDGFEKDAPQTIALRPGDMKGIRFSPLSNNPEDILFSFRNGMEGNGRVEGSGSLVLQPIMHGHFAVAGSINQKPITFMLDTGASVVCVGRTFAVHAGLDTVNCRKQKYDTAEGIITACDTKAKELTLGQFRMTDVEVSIQDNLEDMPLLGMNVIGRFRMEMRNGDMVLSAY